MRDVAPIVAAAARQPQVQGAFRQMARDSGIAVEAARARWIRMQEADLLLESGGDPDALSVAEAVGVAQWLATTGRRNGLRVDLAGSRRLTQTIDALKRRIAWLEYLQLPQADTTLPGAPRGVGRAEAAARIPELRARLEALRRKRQAIDARYDPHRAIFAQTRYLLRLYPRFPRADWLYQAYHGGEQGAARTLRMYLGRAWPGSTAAAIRRGGPGGRALRFEDVYFNTTPRGRPDAFRYLYGRSDDHRYYWWKLRAAEETIARYRRDPAEFARQWEAFLPGRALEAAWYPDAPAEAVESRAELRAALAAGDLVPVTARPGLVVRTLPGGAAALRPEAKGALLLIAAVYRKAGGTEAIVAGDLTVTREGVARRRAQGEKVRKKEPARPLDPLLLGPLPGGGPALDFDFHATGLVFDLARPAKPQQRKVLEYALGWLRDRGILTWSVPRDYAARAYHVAPHPRHAAALSRIGRSGSVPPIPPL